MAFFPLGFTDFRKDFVSAGLVCGKKRYLAVWNLSGDPVRTLPLPGDTVSVSVGYPKKAEKDTELSLDGSVLTIRFPSSPCARLLEIETK